MDTIIFDIDGTLSDVSHRRHFVTNGNRDWGRFFDEMVNDPPLANIVLLAELLSGHPLTIAGDLKLFIFSGRPDSHRAQTEAWLKEEVPGLHNRAEALLMRAAGDYRQDIEVKREMLHAIQKEGYEVRFVVDDRPSVIQMWKSEGLTVLEHDSGEWDSGPAKKWAPGKLHIMVGPSGAGKSHFIVNKWCCHDGSVISTDALRGEITGYFKDQSANDQVFAAAHALVKVRVEHGLSTVVDATNLHARDRRALRDLVPADGEIFYHVIDRPLAEKHRDAGWRKDIIIKDEKLIDRHHKSFQSGLKYVLRGDDDPRVTVHDHRS